MFGVKNIMRTLYASKLQIAAFSAATLVIVGTGVPLFYSSVESSNESPQVGEVKGNSTNQKDGENTVPKPSPSTDPKKNPSGSPVKPSPTSPPTQSKNPVPAPAPITFHNVTASIYGVGEEADASNDFISNVPSAWSSNSVADFGGIDPLSGSRTFAPKHNSYYFALPAAEFNENGLIAGARERSPWAVQIGSLRSNESLFKGRWVKVTRGGKVIYAQWQDVGPNEEQDYGYVFGNGSQQPKNTFGVRAGIDLSPDAARDLGFDLQAGQAGVSWIFVDASSVPAGPWRVYPPIDNKVRW